MFSTTLRSLSRIGVVATRHERDRRCYKECFSSHIGWSKCQEDKDLPTIERFFDRAARFDEEFRKNAIEVFRKQGLFISRGQEGICPLASRVPGELCRR
jgi:hypothetical protein